MVRGKRWGIYKITNKVNGKFYIGSSRNIDKRLREHKRELRLNIHINPHLQSAWNKYGSENFTFEIILLIENEEEKTNKKLRDIETDYILKTKCSEDEYGYNIIKGGRGSLNIPCSEKTKHKISEANKGKIAWNKNTPMEEEQKILLKQIKTELYGKAIDVYSLNGEFIETIPSIREASRLYKCGRNTIQTCLNGTTLPKKWIFVKHGESLDFNKIGKNRILESEEHIVKRKKVYRENRGKKIDVYKFDGTFINTYCSISEVHEQLNVCESTIRDCIHRKRFNKHFIFKIHGDNKPIILTKPQNNCYGDVVYKIYNKNNECLNAFKFKNEVEKYLLNNISNKHTQIKINHFLRDLLPFNEFTIENFVVKLEPALCIGDNTNESLQPINK